MPFNKAFYPVYKIKSITHPVFVKIQGKDYLVQDGDILSFRVGT